MGIAITAASGAIIVGAVIIVFALGFYRPRRFISNFEAAAYGGDRFIEPLTIRHGLAVYSAGNGPPILVFPYPHADTVEPMAQGPLARLLTGMGRRVISFDAPGAYRSTRSPHGGMEEMLDCAVEALEACGVDQVDVIGHSMGSLCALGFSLEHPEMVKRLVLVGGMAGFPAVMRWGMPGSCWKPIDREYWQCMIWGLRLRFGRGSLELHKRLSNLMGRPCWHDPSRFTPLPMLASDRNIAAPARYVWLGNLGWKLDYSRRLSEVSAPTLICAGLHDPEAPLPCSEELARGIPGARMVIFKESAHMIIAEEPERFRTEAGRFLAV